MSPKESARDTTTNTGANTVTVFGADWCSDCRRSKALLDSLEVEYDYVDVEASKEAADLAHAVSGMLAIPVIVFPDAHVQVEPTDAELHEKLVELGIAS